MTVTEVSTTFDSEDDCRSGCRNVGTVTNSSFQNYTHPDDHTRQTTDTPGFKPCATITERLLFIDKNKPALIKIFTLLAISELKKMPFFFSSFAPFPLLPPVATSDSGKMLSVA